MAHAHVPADDRVVSRKLSIAAAANLIIVAGEISVGFWSGSLALIGDALHNLTDAVALLIALIAVRLARREPTASKSFGYHRAGILAAFVNSVALSAFALLVLREAWERFTTPQPVATGPMLIAAAIAMTVNGITALSLHRESQGDVNIRGAFIHMIGDTLSSAGIIVAAIAIRFTGAPQWDPAVSVLIGVLILWSSYGVLRETINLLLEGTPSHVDPQAVLDSLSRIDGIHGVHHLHIWGIGTSSSALSCHLMVGDVPVKSTARLVEEVNSMLAHEFHIAHTTLQVEYAECAEDDPHCVTLTKPRSRTPHPPI